MRPNQTKSILLTGDVMLGRLVDAYLETRSPNSVWGDLLPYFLKADFRMINLECALTKSERRREKVFHFRADPLHVRVLEEAKIDLVNLANNHVLDFDTEGLLETLAVLDQKQIRHVGAGRDALEAKRAQVVQLGDLRIGVIGCTDNEPTWAAGERTPGVFYFSTREKEELLAAVDQIRPDVDLLFASLHWGPNMRERPPAEFVALAHQLVERGVDLLHGHSAHVFQPIELFRGGLILYDTGDFIDDYAVDPLLRNDETFLYLVEIEGKKIGKLSLLPAVISNCRVERAEGGDFSEIVRRLRGRSDGFEQKFALKEGGFFQAPHLELEVSSV